MDTNNLGEILHERRKAKKLSLKQVEELSGVSISHIGRIERGQRFPSAPTLRRLAAPLDFTEIELFKIAGFLSQAETDIQIRRLKEVIKLALMELCEKVDNLKGGS